MSNPAERVVEELVSAGLVDPARSGDARSVVAHALADPGAPGAAAPGRRTGTRSRLVEIAGYAGGALVMAAVGLFLAQEWSSLSGAAQVGALAGIAVVLAVAGVAVSRVGGGPAVMRSGRDEVRRRLASALLVGAAVAAALAVNRQVELLLDDEFSDWPTLAGVVTLIVLGIAAYAFAPSALALVVIAAAGFQGVITGWVLPDRLEASSVWQGLTLMVLGAVWLGWAETRGFREDAVGRTIGVGYLLFGAQMILVEGSYANLAYALTAVVAVAGFVLYVRTVAWPYLVAGVLGITLVVPEAVIDWTGGALGPAGAVLVAGLTLLGAAVVGLRVRKEAGDAPDQPPAEQQPRDSGHRVGTAS